MNPQKKIAVSLLGIVLLVSACLVAHCFHHEEPKMPGANQGAPASATLVVDSIDSTSRRLIVKGRISNWTAIAGTGISIELDGSGKESQLRPKMWCDVEFQTYDVQADQVIVPKNGKAIVTDIADHCDYPSASVAFSKQFPIRPKRGEK